MSAYSSRHQLRNGVYLSSIVMGSIALPFLLSTGIGEFPRQGHMGARFLKPSSQFGEVVFVICFTQFRPG
jgi:hypothetical protein